MAPRKCIRFLCVVCFLLFSVSGINCQDARIRIAVLDLVNSGSVTPREAAEINVFFRNAISETAVFEMVEREMLDTMLEEQKLQLTGAIDESEIISFGKVYSVRQLLMGSVGRLFGKLIMTAQLVDAETGKIVFAQTLVTSEDDFYDDIRKFAVEIASKAIDATIDITVGMIEAEIKKKQYIQAKRYLDVYITETGITTETRALRDRIVPELAALYIREAEKLLKGRKFDEALVYVQKALALRIDDRYIALRDRIFREEEEYQEKQRIAEEKRQQRMKKREARYQWMANQGEDTLVGAYLSQISVCGVHVGVANSWEMDSSYSLPNAFGKWGGELILAGDPVGTSSPRKEDRGRGSENSLGYLGVSVSMSPLDNGNLLEAKAYLSPYTALGLKMANLVLILGADGGALVRFAQTLSGGFDWGALAGVSALAEIKFNKTLGIYAMVRGEYLWFPEDPGASAPALNISTGMVF